MNNNETNTTATKLTAHRQAVLDVVKAAGKRGAHCSVQRVYATKRDHTVKKAKTDNGYQGLNWLICAGLVTLTKTTHRSGEERVRYHAS